MEKRKEQLLQLIIEHHIATAQPVGSQFLSALDALKVSAATIRNEMRDLEADGYLTHPHTSAGRVPSQLGYRYYVDTILKAKKTDAKIKTLFEQIAEEHADEKMRLKTIAKLISSHVGSAVIVAFNKDALYYTGIGNLFAQPEFKNYEHTVNVSTLFDRCEEVIESVFERTQNDYPILIGEENPFGGVCSLVSTRFGKEGMISVLGPMRMHYGKVLQILNHIPLVIK